MKPEGKGGAKRERVEIDFSKVKVEPLFEEEVDFDTFSKSDFRAVKIKSCEEVKKSDKLLNSLERPQSRSQTFLRGR